jgi:hypothetical protein
LLASDEIEFRESEEEDEESDRDNLLLFLFFFWWLREAGRMYPRYWLTHSTAEAMAKFKKGSSCLTDRDQSAPPKAGPIDLAAAANDWPSPFTCPSLSVVTL